MDYEKIFEDLRLKSIALLKRQEQLKWNPSSFLERLFVESELNECRYELLRFTCPKSHLPADIAFLKTLSLSDPPIPEKHLRHKFCSCIFDEEDKTKTLLDKLSPTTSNDNEHASKCKKTEEAEFVKATPMAEVTTTEHIAKDEPLPDPSNDLPGFDEPVQETESTVDHEDGPNERVIQPQPTNDGCSMNASTTLTYCDPSAGNPFRPSYDADDVVTSNGPSDKKKNGKRHQKRRARADRSGKIAHFDWVEEVEASRPLDSETALSFVDTGVGAQQTVTKDFSTAHSDVNCLRRETNDAQGRDCYKRIYFVDYAIRHLGVPDPPDGPQTLSLVVRLPVTKSD